MDEILKQIYKKHFIDYYTWEQFIRFHKEGKIVALTWGDKDKKLLEKTKRNVKIHKDNKANFSSDSKRMRYKFTKDLEEHILNYCYSNGFTMKTMASVIGISSNTFYSIQKRGIFGPATAFKLKKVLPDFDFNSIRM